MAARALRLVILGAPASGKGTISGRIVSRYGITHVSSGELLRWHVAQGSALGAEARGFMESGALVPDEAMARLVLGRLKEVSGTWLLDGYPRTGAQAERLWSEMPVNAALNLAVPLEEVVRRTASRWIHPASGRVYNTEYKPPKVPGKDDETGEPLEQRPDDKPEAVRHRLQLYTQMAEPVMAYYRKKNVLHEFAGNTSDEIWPKVTSYLDTILPVPRG